MNFLVFKDLAAYNLSTLPNSLFIFGSERYLVFEAKTILSNLIPESIRPFNLINFSQDNIRGAIDTSLSVPVFCQKRIVIINNVAKIADSDFSILEKYLAKPNDSTCLVIIASENLDLRSKTYTKLRKMSITARLDRLNLLAAKNSIKQYIKQQGGSISELALNKLTNYTGSSLFRLKTEANKLLLLSSNISDADIDKIVFRSDVESADNIWAMFRSCNRVGLIASIGRLLDEGIQALYILGILASVHRKAISSNTEYSNLKSRLGLVKLTENIQLIAEADFKIKNSIIPPKLAINTLILEITKGL